MLANGSRAPLRLPVGPGLPGRRPAADGRVRPEAPEAAVQEPVVPVRAPGGLAPTARQRLLHLRGLGSAKLANFAKFCKFLAGSFSAVSKRIFASTYAFDSIFQNLPNNLAEFFEILQDFRNFAAFANFLLNFHETCCFFKPMLC